MGKGGLHQNPPWGTENKIQCDAHAFQFNEALSSGFFKSFCCAINSMHTIQPSLATNSTNATELSCIFDG